MLACLWNAFRKARTYHVAVHPSGRTIPFLRSLRTGAAIVSVEVFHPADEVLPHSELQYGILAVLTIVTYLGVNA